MTPGIHVNISIHIYYFPSRFCDHYKIYIKYLVEKNLDSPMILCSSSFFTSPNDFVISSDNRREAYVVLVLWKHRNKVFLMSEKSLDAGRKLQSPNSNGGT